MRGFIHSLKRLHDVLIENRICFGTLVNFKRQFGSPKYFLFQKGMGFAKHPCKIWEI